MFFEEVLIEQFGTLGVFCGSGEICKKILLSMKRLADAEARKMILCYRISLKQINFPSSAFAHVITKYYLKIPKIV